MSTTQPASEYEIARKKFSQTVQMFEWRYTEVLLALCLDPLIHTHEDVLTMIEALWEGYSARPKGLDHGPW